MKHKRFLSMAALLILVLSAVFLVTACPTGTTPSSGSNSGGAVTPPAVNAEETELTALLGKISLDKTIITAVTESITISNFPSIPEATVGIASNNIELIKYKAPNQLKVKALPTETADVKITVTLTKNGISKSRDFTVKVFKSGDTPTEDDYFNTLTIPTTVSDDFNLPKELKNTESTAITWSTKNENIIKIEGATDKIAVVIPDLIEKKVKLTATANGKTKDFEVTVLPVVKAESNGINGPNSKSVYEFTQNSINVQNFRNDKLSGGILYSYTLNGENKKITTKLISILLPEGNKWITIEEYYSFIIDMEFTYIKNLLKGIDSLLSKPTISIADLKKGLKNFFYEDVSGYDDKEFFENVLKKRPFFFTMTYEQFIALSHQEQTNKIKAVLTEVKKEMARSVGLPENASTEDILSKGKKIYQQFVASQIKELKEPCTYTYSIRKDPGGNLHFETKVVYNPSKPLYENRGVWSYNHEPSSPEISWIYSTYASKHPNGTIEGGLSIKENHTHNHYRGTITGNGPNYTFSGSLQDDPSKQITATITDNKDGTIKVKVTSGGTAESTLTFEGRSL